VLVGDQLLEDGMEIQALDGKLEAGQQPDGETNSARRVQNIDAAAKSLDGLGSVERAPLQKFRPFVRIGRFFQRLRFKYA